MQILTVRLISVTGSTSPAVHNEFRSERGVEVDATPCKRLGNLAVECVNMWIFVAGGENEGENQPMRGCAGNGGNF